MSFRFLKKRPLVRAMRAKSFASPENLEARTLLTSGFDIYPTLLNERIEKPAIVAGSDGNLWFADGQYGVGRITPTGTITNFPVVSDTLTLSVNGLTPGKDGNIWFTAGSSLGSIDPAGLITLTPISDGHSGFAITTDSAGDFWFTDENGNVEEYKNGTFTTITLPNTSASTNNDQRIAVTSDGSVWVNAGRSVTTTTTNGSSSYFEKAIDRIAPDGTVTVAATLENDYSKVGLTAGPDGNLWFVEETGTSAIGKIAIDGTVSKFVVVGSPTAITSGPDGALWFTIPYKYPDIDINGAAIGRITTDGNLSYYAPSTADSYKGLDQIHAITSGPDGALWFAAGYGGTIGRLDPSSGPGNDLPLVLHQKTQPTPPSDPGPIGVVEPISITVGVPSDPVMGNSPGGSASPIYVISGQDPVLYTPPTQRQAHANAVAFLRTARIEALSVFQTTRQGHVGIRTAQHHFYQTILAARQDALTIWRSGQGQVHPDALLAQRLSLASHRRGQR